jgi:steroid 5-alpha reductase family enzyme
VRLAIHIGRRHKGEDWRYVELIRTRWAKCGPVGSAIAAYLYVFALQGLFSMVGNGTCIHIMRNSTVAQNEGKLGITHYIGIAVWVIGVLIETIGDIQLQAHRDDESKKGTLIKTGLWRYTRHPNYFGEALSWWGIYIIACGAPEGYWTFWSALFITLLLRYVSGVRMLELK